MEKESRGKEVSEKKNLLNLPDLEITIHKHLITHIVLRLSIQGSIHSSLFSLNDELLQSKHS